RSTWAERLEEFFWAAFGLYAFAGVLQWYLERPLNVVTAALLTASGCLLIWPPLPLYLHLTGLALLVAVVAWQKKRAR
ncbi:MAG: hypothetical protein OEX13_16660, partial [Gammaproteobacteria bacterium]|nr:hypothetical protein [Gammaproteobacteria bacterium]